ncbi:hypothetical protein GVN16_24930 [Emticicia sp. CRIBPO]|uniref:sensor histidine kinase n=1 Tax=Emticicia sp. CRIBPO TaxID=2683258 RepID=UPI001411BF4D|nr:7TM diverse intracellular signaling domain-containing protein [Emticicia sp. CRIBPO]NBA89045.1 hypothetical protein [Emticicia sp. CRIBPO]
MTRNLVFLLLVVVLAISGLAWYHFDSVKTIKSLPLNLEHLEAGDLPPEVILKSSGFKAVVKQQLNYGYTENIHWFRFELEAGLVPRELSLEITNHVINNLELFEMKRDTMSSLGKTGDWYPFRHRPSPTKNFVYPIYLDSYEKAVYLLKIDKRYENLTTGINLWNTNDFENSDQRAYLLWGIFIGVVFLITVLNVIFGWITSDRIYIWFTFYIITLSLRQLADSGLAFQYIWPEWPAMNRPNQLLEMVWLFLVAMLKFQQYFFDLKNKHKVLYYLAQGFKYFFITGLLALLVLQISGFTSRVNIESYLIRIHTVASTLCTVLFFFIAAVGLRSADILQRFFAVAFFIQLIGFVFVIVQNLLNYQSKGLFFIEAHIVYLLIFLIDMIFFVYILSVRYRNSHQRNQQLQIGLIQAQQDVNQRVIESLGSERGQINEMLAKGVGDLLLEAQNELKDVSKSAMLTDAVRLIDKAGQDLKQISLNLIPIEFAEKGLVKALNDMITGLNKTQKINFAFTVLGQEIKLTTAKEVQVFRIASEMINNILKHSEATKAEIKLDYKDKLLVLSASDNGKGFDLQELEHTSGGIGLKNFYSRASYLKAEINLSSGSDGTLVVLSIPV